MVELNGGIRYVDICNGDMFVILEKPPSYEGESRTLALVNISLGYIMLDFQKPEELAIWLNRNKNVIIRIRERSI